MALAHRLDLRTSQSLVMTPQLQQAIKLLQLSNLELSAVIDQEIERNPLLDRAASDQSGGPVEAAAYTAEPGDGADAPAPAGASWDGDPRQAADDATADPDESPEGNDWEPSSTAASSIDWGMRLSGAPHDPAHGDGPGDWRQASLAEPTSLRDHIRRQIDLELATLHERMIAAHLTEWLDEAGYLRGGVAETARHLGVGEDQVSAVLARLQQFEPTGLFARDLAECLSLQLAERGQFDAVMQRLMQRLDLVAKRDYRQLARVCGVAVTDLVERVALIRTLDPKPASRFDDHVAQPVTPDILMREDGAGGWEIELNPDTLPRVLIDRRYYARIKAATSPRSADRAFIAEQLANASWLVKALEQRATTILSVAREIVRRQAGFFTEGISGLRPLVLRDIAEAISMHESTISRVTANKYIATPRGVFDLKYFFSGAVGAGEGESHAAASVRHRIKTMIDGEAPGAVLSDDQIVAALRAEGIDIARRTVAKYREGMRIPSSVQRRREKALGRGAA